MKRSPTKWELFVEWTECSSLTVGLLLGAIAQADPRTFSQSSSLPYGQGRMSAMFQNSCAMQYPEPAASIRVAALQRGRCRLRDRAGLVVRTPSFAVVRFGIY